MTNRRARARSDPERGQAVTETLLLLSILVTFVAAVYQVFLVNDQVFKALAAAEVLLFQEAFATDCYTNSPDCHYASDGGARVEWSQAEMPEVIIPVLGMFQRAGLPAELPITAASGRAKLTIAGSGTYLPPFTALSMATVAAACGCDIDEGKWTAVLDEAFGGLAP